MATRHHRVRLRLVTRHGARVGVTVEGDLRLARLLRASRLVGERAAIGGGRSGGDLAERPEAFTEEVRRRDLLVHRGGVSLWTARREIGRDAAAPFHVAE